MDDEKLEGFYGNLASEDNRFLILDGKLVGFAPAGLTVCSIPEGVKEIGAGTISYSEYNESELAELRIPDSVTSVAEGAISRLPNLKAIYSQFATKDNRCLIMDGKLLAFAPAGLTTYSIPEGVKEIGEWVFYCYGLTDITIPDGVETIGLCAFMSSGLTSVNIPDGVKTIGDYAFESSGLTSVNISDGVKTIGDGAFYGCGLTTVTIPKSVTSIGYGAFNCKSLESVTVEATTPPTLGRFAFGYVGDEYNVHKLEIEINVPKASVDTYKNAKGWEEYAEYIRGM